MVILYYDLGDLENKAKVIYSLLLAVLNNYLCKFG